MAKKAKPTQLRRSRVSREGFVEKRKAPRQIHIIDEHSTDRDITLAQADLDNFFLGVLEKHHGF